MQQFDLTKRNDTKIIVDIGPAVSNYEQIKTLIEAGASGIRIDFYTTDRELIARQAKWARKASKELNKPIALIQDLKGPELYLGDFKGYLPIEKNQLLRFRYQADYEREGVLPIRYDLSGKLKRGEKIFFLGLSVKVTSVKDKIIYAEAENEGILISNQLFMLADTDFTGDVITEQDRKDLVFGQENDFDYVVMNYAQTADDIRALRWLMKNLNYDAKIIANILSAASIQNFEDIAAETDLLMQSVEPLTSEMDDEGMPFLTFKLLDAAKRYNRPIIAANHDLISMSENRYANRHDTYALANRAVLAFDSIVLGQEISGGKHPGAAVKQAVKICQMASGYKQSLINPDNGFDDSQIASNLVRLSAETKAAAIIAETKSGATAIKISSLRPKQPVFISSPSPRVSQQLAIVYGCQPLYQKGSHGLNKITDVLARQRILKIGDIVIIGEGRYPGVVGPTDTIKIRAIE